MSFVASGLLVSVGSQTFGQLDTFRAVDDEVHRTHCTVDPLPIPNRNYRHIQLGEFQ